MALEKLLSSQPSHQGQPFDESVLGEGPELVLMPVGEQMDIVGYFADADVVDHRAITY
jgi:hypothetical protein